MRAVRVFENRAIAGYGVELLARFGLVGIIATVIYAALTTALLQLDWAGFSFALASLVAYASAAVFSYIAHKVVTFASSGSHRREGPRFVLLTATGFAVAYVMPVLLTGTLGLPPVIPILVTCTLMPVANLFMLDRWVFAARQPCFADQADDSLMAAKTEPDSVGTKHPSGEFLQS